MNISAILLKQDKILSHFMSKTKEELLARKQEILDFLSKHYSKDPEMMGNFTTKYPDYSATAAVMDESDEAHEVEDYERDLIIEQAMEQELAEIEESLASM